MHSIINTAAKVTVLLSWLVEGGSKGAKGSTSSDTSVQSSPPSNFINKIVEEQI